MNTQPERKDNTLDSIPLIKADLPAFADVEQAFREILENGKITNFGKYVNRFEEDAAKYLGVGVATVSSGTMGLLFSLHALGLEKGQKVVFPSFTFMATAQATLYAGGTPVFTECLDDLTMCPEDLARTLEANPETAVVIPVHIYGLPCHMDEIQRVVDAHSKKTGRRVRILCDAAHAFGASRGGKKVGGFGDVEVFSLSVTKTLVSVEGGMVCSRDEELIRRVKKMRNYGIEDNYDAKWPGLNGKMSEFHAIIGIENLKQIERILSARKEKAAYYRRAVESRAGFRVFDAPAGVVHTYKDFSVLLPPEWKERRSKFMETLKELGVETRAYFYPPVHEQGHFKRFTTRPLPKTEDLSRRVVTLPFFTAINESQMDRVAEALGEAKRRLS